MGFWGKVGKITSITLITVGGVVAVGSSVMLGFGTNLTYDTTYNNQGPNQPALAAASNSSVQLGNGQLKPGYNLLDYGVVLSTGTDASNLNQVDSKSGYGVFTQLSADGTQTNLILKIDPSQTYAKVDFTAFRNGGFKNVMYLSSNNADQLKNMVITPNVGDSASTIQGVNSSWDMSPSGPLIVWNTTAFTQQEMGFGFGYRVFDVNGNVAIDTNQSTKSNLLVQNFDINMSSMPTTASVAKAGDNLSLDAAPKLNNVASNGTINYQWYEITTSNSTPTPINGQTSSVLNITTDAQLNGAQVYCVATYNGIQIQSPTCTITVPTDQPSNPNPDQPSNPNPDQPTNPNPDQPSNPNPDQPTNPDQPSNPNPDQPSNPNPDQPSNEQQPQNGDKISIGVGSQNYGQYWLNNKNVGKIKLIINSSNVIENYNDLVNYAKNYVDNNKNNQDETYHFCSRVILANDLMIAGAVLLPISALVLIAGIIILVLSMQYRIYR